MNQTKAFIITLIAIIVFSVSPAYAEESQEAEHHNLSFHIFHPLSTTETPVDSSNINISLFYSRMGEVHGLDAGHGFSLISGDMYGVQASGLANWTGGKMYGLQASGAINVAQEVRGVQIGIVNLSDQMHGVPLGLINISRNGGVQLSGWYSTLNEANTGVRFRAGNFYTLFGFGLTSGSYTDISEAVDTAEEISHSLAFGVSLPAGIFALNFDGGVISIDRGRFYELDEGSDQIGLRYRGMLELRLFSGLSVFGGTGAAYMMDAKQEPTEEDFENGQWEELYFFGAGIEW
ncbi:MAG: LA_2272 family surface repeat-containing protein [Spirochaetota bacterium]